MGRPSMSLAQNIVLTGLLACSQPLLAQALEVDLPVNGVAYDRHSGFLYATVPSSAGLPYGNHVVEISPSMGVISRSLFVGSEPDPIAISPDQSSAFVGLDGSDQARMLDLSSLTAGVPFSLYSDNLGGYHVRQMSVMPGAPSTMVAALTGCCGVAYAGIFDAGVRRGSVTNDGPSANTLGLSNDGTKVFTFDNYSTAFELARFAVTTTGLALETLVPDGFYGFYQDIVVSNDIIYATDGGAARGSDLQLIGTYQSHGPLVVDDDAQLVIFAEGTDLEIFDRDTFVPLQRMHLSAAQGNPTAASGCGTRCVAVVYDSQRMLIVPHVGDELFQNGFE